jgi:protein-S-isoprenylcysteine O-methyltransferase Ste14
MDVRKTGVRKSELSLNNILSQNDLMKNVIKHITSFILPVTVLIIVPWMIEFDFSIKNIIAFIFGLVLIFSGLCVMAVTITSFIRIGKGTLAPWFPTKKLIITGIYAYVRNPMILGVLTVLAGESIAFLSYNIFIWAVIFFIFNTIFFIVYEEPSLKKRFGDDYLDYKRNVHRWIPRLKPFKRDIDKKESITLE